MLGHRSGRPGNRHSLSADDTGSAASRRTFLAFLAASPLIAAALGTRGALAQGLAPDDPRLLHLMDYVIQSPEEALTVLDFEAAARKVLPPAHFGYLTTGTMGEDSLQRNRAAFRKYGVDAHPLVDVSSLDTSTSFLGQTFRSPIFLAPVGGGGAFHPLAERPVAAAAKTRDTNYILSTRANISVEEATRLRGAPIWYQLYINGVIEDDLAVIKRAEDAGCPAIALTVDLLTGRDTETSARFARLDERTCTQCHNGATPEDVNRRFPMVRDYHWETMQKVTLASTSWDYVKRLRDATKGNFLLKGIMAPEDAKLAVKHGIDGVIVSNHGGRAMDGGVGTMDVLEDIVTAVKGRIPVTVDGGFRRGTDVFKALALGARAINIGRPYLWGLASFGQAGVETVIDLINTELQLIMKQAGTRSLADIGPHSIRRLS